ncbi:YCF48-related protein [Pelomonas sp. SE-A7]|uniref:WD40/YVTN/BNR-like repeat-containing protein n=1 Tax=Pelomonas sp. SE-A7 TaxID=3054953 RepID=UPI00259C7143|nr:YCF48-related protein [Pelomonas sp. SE-A7]MDM4764463.1 YCF48-related protein [Pelomonas sp. SE-A7]
MKRIVLPLLLAAAAMAASAAGFRDPLDQPAQASRLAPKASLSAVARVGAGLVVAGSRGHVLRSDDEGRTWQQASVPVSSDLVALSFPDALHGWAVGHDAVILASSDGGKSWQRQFDGRQLGPQGAESPLLDVWFDDASRGWAVGAFGQILSTGDGGKTWTGLPAAQSDNPKALHLYAVRRIAGSLYLAGEQGLLLRWDDKAQRFAALSQPYAGTLFGITGDGGLLLIHGLRGHALRSVDGGRSWEPVATGLQVGLTGSARTAEGHWLLASQAGHVLLSRDEGRSFQPLKLQRPLPISGLATVGQRGLLLVGPRGLQTQNLP